MVTKEMLKKALTQLGVEKGMVLEVHSSLSSFGELEGGAETVISDKYAKRDCHGGRKYFHAGA